MTKQILEIIEDCRRCPNYCFSQRYPGGIIFACDVKNNMEDKLIPYNRLNEINFIHEDCILDDHNG